MGEYIKQDQVGFMKGRHMSDLTKRVIDLIDKANQSKEKIGILSLDIFKAFDSIQWISIKKIIDSFGFGSRFARIVDKLYQKGVANIKVNRSITQDILLQAGTRQGCPLSPVLFIMAMELLANAIREDPLIDGMSGNKINLYADDTLLIVKQPNKALTRIKKHLNAFEEVTGLKINWEKTEMITCNINLSDRLEINKNYQIHIKEHLRYLGIIISNNYEELKRLNYDKQEQKVKQQILQYKKLNLSWFGRVSMAKMMLLPQFNFLFDALPIYLKDKDLRRYQTLIDNYCNGGKRARITKSLWYISQKKGGLGIPNLTNYYRAFQLKGIVKILMNDKQIWEEMEMQDLKKIGKVFFWGLGSTKVHITNNMMKSMVMTWKKVRQKMISNFSLVTNLEDCADFPCKINEDLKHRLKINKVYLLKDWLHQCSEETKKKMLFDNLKLDWFQRFRLSNWVKNLQQRIIFATSMTDFEQLVSKIRADEGVIKGLVSKLYQILNKHDNPNQSLRENWESDLKMKIPEKVWDSTWHKRVMRMLSIRVKEHNYKLLWRWYMTPARLNQINNNYSRLCWRCKKETGLYIHMWWECHVVKQFWNLVEAEISAMLGMQFNIDPRVALLMNIQEKRLDLAKKELVTILVTTARMCIARKWKSADSVSLQEWYKETWQIALNDKLTQEMNLRKGLIKENNFWKIWQPFISFATKEEVAILPVQEQLRFWV